MSDDIVLTFIICSTYRTPTKQLLTADMYSKNYVHALFRNHIKIYPEANILADIHSVRWSEGARAF